MKKNKFLLKIKSQQFGIFCCLVVFLFVVMNHASGVAAQEIAPTAAEASPEAIPLADENFKLTFDKIDSSRFYNKAVLQVLNKTTAKTSVVEISIGGFAEIGKLSVKVNKCWQAPLDQKPDSRILLEIFETKSDNSRKRIFFGWMISSSPSVSSLEHPIYDVTALGCKNK